MYSHVGVKVDVHVTVCSPCHCSNYASLLKLYGVKGLSLTIKRRLTKSNFMEGLCPPFNLDLVT